MCAHDNGTYIVYTGSLYGFKEYCCECHEIVNEQE